MTNLTMVIDLNRCVRCRTCYVACKREHGILSHPRDKEHPYEYYRLRYIEWEWGKYPIVKRGFIPTSCMQCNDPICIKFCPEDAIVQRSNGVLMIKKGLCNGCGVCVNVCPYKALYINHDGKADVCDFCTDRLSIGLPPKCVEMCPGKARIFGDLADPESDVTKIFASGFAKPLAINEVRAVKTFYIPSLHEPMWEELATNEGFQVALKRRQIDLPPVKGIV